MSNIDDAKAMIGQMDDAEKQRALDAHFAAFRDSLEAVDTKQLSEYLYLIFTELLQRDDTGVDDEGRAELLNKINSGWWPIFASYLTDGTETVQAMALERRTDKSQLN